MFNNYYFIQKTYIIINYVQRKNKKVHFDNYIVKLYYKQPVFINNISIHEQQKNIKIQTNKRSVYFCKFSIVTKQICSISCFI